LRIKLLSSATSAVTCHISNSIRKTQQCTGTFSWYTFIGSKQTTCELQGGPKSARLEMQGRTSLRLALSHPRQPKADNGCGVLGRVSKLRLHQLGVCPWGGLQAFQRGSGWSPDRPKSLHYFRHSGKSLLRVQCPINNVGMMTRCTLEGSWTHYGG